MLDIYPAIDVIDDKCVRLTKGKFDQVKVYDSAINVAKKYKKENFEWLHIIDLKGSLNGRSSLIDLAVEIKEKTQLKVQLGGGFRTIKQVRMALEQGIDRILISGLSYDEPEAVKELIAEYSNERIGFCWDGKIIENEFRLLQKGWTEVSSVSLDALTEAYGEMLPSLIFMTNVEKDGTLEGIDRSFYEFIKSKYPQIPIGISGGVASLNDLKLNKDLSSSFIVGKALLEGRIQASEVVTC